MSTQRGYSTFPAAFLTFSLLLLVLAGGFAVGRLVVGRAYLKTVGQSDKLPIARPQSDSQPGGDYEHSAGQGYVPAPAEPAEARDRQRAERESPPGERPGAPQQDLPSDMMAATDDQRVQPPPAEEPPPEEQPAKRYAIQIGVFGAQEGAQQVADDLARAGYPARVESSKGDNGTVYRVVTGRYRTEYAARKAMDQLRQEGFPGFLVER